MNIRATARHYAGTVLAAVALAGVSACSTWNHGGGCTEMGASTSFSFDFSSVTGQAQSGELWTVRACVETTCEERTKPAKRFHGRYQMADPPTSGDPVSATLTIVDQDGNAAFDGSAQVSPEKFQPNGQGCDPIGWVAEVKTRGRSDLVVVSEPLK